MSDDDKKVFSLERFRPKNTAHWAKIDAEKRKASTVRKRKPKRPPIPVPYSAIPKYYTDKLQASKAGRTAWALLHRLDHLIYGPSRKDPLTITAKVCRAWHLSPKQVRDGLRQLERAELAALSRQDGRGFVVYALWRRFPPAEM